MISPAAVTCITGGAHSDITPLGEWDRERAAFDRLCRLGFFRNFITRRSFTWWRSVRARPVLVFIERSGWAAKCAGRNCLGCWFKMTWPIFLYP